MRMDASIQFPVTPLLYDPSFEVEEKDEQNTKAELLKSLQGISETTFKDTGVGLRSVHAKSHGLLHGELRVLDDLPPMLAQGIFANPASYPFVMRFSTSAGDMLDDSVSLPRGIALKVIGVDGERLEGSEGDVTQDFVMINGPVFLVPGPKKFAGSLKLLAATTDKGHALKKALSAALRGTEKLIEAMGSESGLIKAMGGHPETHILGETFFSQVPILFGPYMVKVSLAPVSPSLMHLKNAPLDVTDKPDGLREAVVDFFKQHSAEWELRVQFCTNLEDMPIEDASKEWPQEDSPYIAVARVTALPQAAWNEELQRTVDQGMAFSPWHGIAAHRPIGSIMRVRKAAYELSKKMRALHNGAAVTEPVAVNEFHLDPHVDAHVPHQTK